MLVAYTIVVIASCACWMWLAISQGHHAVEDGEPGVDRAADAERAKRDVEIGVSTSATHASVAPDATGATAQLICEVP